MSELRFLKKIALNLGIAEKQVSATVQLLDEGATIPFISRYRKEMTGSLDEVQVANVRDEIERLRTLEKRREAIMDSIEGQGKLTPELMPLRHSHRSKIFIYRTNQNAEHALPLLAKKD
jgi:uncharacterized protein